jgi:hypothetical protein
MNTANLPDFDELYALIGSIRDKSIEVAKKKLSIKVLEKDVFVRGRDEGLPVTHVTNAYKTTGFDGEITDLRADLAKTEAELAFMENTLDLHKSKIEVWRTVSANERTGIA